MNQPPSRNRLTFELSDELLTSLNERASREERTLSGQIRHLLNIGLGLTDEPEPARDATPDLPGMP